MTFYEMLEQVGPRIRGLRENPELNALMNDPEVVAMVSGSSSKRHIVAMPEVSVSP